MPQMGPPGSKFCAQLDCSINSLTNNMQQFDSIAEAQGDTNSCKQDSSSYSNSNRTFLSVCHDISNNLTPTLEASPHPQTNLKTSPDPNPDLHCMECPDCESLKEGQGESSACEASPTLWDNSEGIIGQGSLTRLSPTVASCFCKDIEEEQEYFQQLLGSSSRGWTDEKHSSYLDSMEADFVRNVMYKSGGHAEPSELDDSASSHQAKASMAAREFKVCQNGRWRPMCVQSQHANFGTLKQIAVAVKNPWIKRFKAAKRVHFPLLILEDPLLKAANTRFSNQPEE